MVLIQVGMATGGSKKFNKSASSLEEIKVGIKSLTYGEKLLHWTWIGSNAIGLHLVCRHYRADVHWRERLIVCNSI